MTEEAVRPDYVPENFWNTETKSINTEEAFKHLGEITSQHETLTGEHDTLKTELDTLRGQHTAPESYEFKAAEGRELDAQAVELATPLFKELGLSQEGAQKLIDMQSQLVAANEQKLEDSIKAQNDEWTKTVANDKDIDIDVAQKALGKFGDEDLTKYLKESGLGNHPGLLKLMTKVGKAISEDDAHLGGSGGKDSSDLTRIYDHPTSQVN